MVEIERVHEEILSAFWEMFKVSKNKDLSMERFMQRVAMKAKKDIHDNPNDMEIQRKAHIRLAVVSMSMAAACKEDDNE